MISDVFTASDSGLGLGNVWDFIYVFINFVHGSKVIHTDWKEPATIRSNRLFSQIARRLRSSAKGFKLNWAEVAQFNGVFPFRLHHATRWDVGGVTHVWRVTRVSAWAETSPHPLQHAVCPKTYSDVNSAQIIEPATNSEQTFFQAPQLRCGLCWEKSDGIYRSSPYSCRFSAGQPLLTPRLHYRSTSASQTLQYSEVRSDPEPSAGRASAAARFNRGVFGWGGKCNTSCISGSELGNRNPPRDSEVSRRKGRDQHLASSSRGRIRSGQRKGRTGRDTFYFDIMFSFLLCGFQTEASLILCEGFSKEKSQRIDDDLQCSILGSFYS